MSDPTSAPNPYAETERALLDWHERLAAKEARLARLQDLLIEWGAVLQKMATVQGEIDTLQRGEPIASGRPAPAPSLRLVRSPGDPEEGR